ncbi:hypothetical protein [Tichowtungia aerotolerans]|uniref:Uncharacterized protein n=1 Tax=Tichowtungia aerotolerans TaxID=2697043 RepID=A0A6P1M951_9BACT|nr:hypothetical protein [Tichowtungia aerotolerans]QHI69593.1 hypothetical protein GT409_09030 [Tichowtungia aerotolerans]
MKRFITFILFCAALSSQAAQTGDPIGIAAEKYFRETFARLGEVAAKKPTPDTFRKAMKPCAEATDGFFGGTYIDTDYTIRQVYYKRNFLARGFSLRKVDQLTYFWDLMDKSPAPQLSEPGHSLTQPIHLIALRYPILTNGKLEGVVSMMIRTKAFLKASGLDQCSAWKIICRGEEAEEDGNLSDHYREVKLTLPSTEWVIQYDPKEE